MTLGLLLSSILTSCPVIDKVTKTFEQINRSKTIRPGFKINVSQAPAPLHFESFYRRLSYFVSFKNPQMHHSAETLYITASTQTTLAASVLVTSLLSMN